MLDPEGRVELIETVKKIKKDYKMTVLSITHDLEEVALSDRVLVMKEGNIESSSSPKELFSRNDLEEMGLDQLFTNQVVEALSDMVKPPSHYLTENELEEYLWESLLKK